MKIIRIKKPAPKQLPAAIAIASGLATSALSTAGTYTAILSGAIVDQQNSVLGVPGVSSSPTPPAYQKPVLVPYGGPGWSTELTLSIDSGSGGVTAVEERTTEGFISGGGGNIAGRYAPGVFWSSGTAFPSPGCQVISANPGETGTIVYSCPLASYIPGFIDYSFPGYQCLTPTPSSTNFYGGNGCANYNGGITFPGGIPNWQPPEPTYGAHIAVPAASGLSPFPLVNPDFYATNDPEQYFNGIALRAYKITDSGASLSRNGVDFTIYHSGSFSGFDFQITRVNLINRSEGPFDISGGALPSGGLESFNQSEYSTLLRQSYTPAANELGKPVPAIGAFGLAALFMGLLGITGKLIQR